MWTKCSSATTTDCGYATKREKKREPSPADTGDGGVRPSLWVTMRWGNHGATWIAPNARTQCFWRQGDSQTLSAPQDNMRLNVKSEFSDGEMVQRTPLESLSTGVARLVARRPRRVKVGTRTATEDLDVRVVGTSGMLACIHKNGGYNGGGPTSSSRRNTNIWQ